MTCWRAIRLGKTVQVRFGDRLEQPQSLKPDCVQDFIVPKNVCFWFSFGLNKFCGQSNGFIGLLIVFDSDLHLQFITKVF